MEANQPDRTNVRELPKNIEAEQVVLGSAFLEPHTVVPLLIERLIPEHFHERRHRVIFRAIRDLFDRGEPCDVILLANLLEETGSMERAGGRMYLNELLDRTTTTASVEYYADVVRRKATLRDLVEAGGRISELGFEESRDTEEVLNQAEEMIFSISNKGLGTPYVLLTDFLTQHIDALEKLKAGAGQTTLSGLSTGFSDLDELTAGMQPSDLVIVAGRPGTGKTSFLLTLARHMAIREDAKIGFFSLEMTKEHLLERLLCGQAKVNLHHLRQGKLPFPKWRTLVDVANKLSTAKIMVDDTPAASIFEIRARARRMKSQVGLDVVMLDYLQLAEAGIRTSHREQEVAYISRSLKRLARELDVCVVAASQLNRSPEGRPERRPRLADLRESGAIEQDADVVMFIYREDYHREQEDRSDQNAKETSVEAEVIIAKQRNGPTGNTKVTFHKAFASFYPMSYGPD